jgi:hypothetical protein
MIRALLCWFGIHRWKPIEPKGYHKHIAMDWCYGCGRTREHRYSILVKRP